jgi:hypothetical protein
MVHAPDQFFPHQDGAGTARPWPRHGILPPQWGAGGKRNLVFNQRVGGPARGKNLLRRAPGAWLRCYRRRTGWPKILNRARQLAVPFGPVYIAGRTGELSACSTIARP